MICEKCGAEIADEDMFCSNCGAKVVKEQKKEISEVEEYKLKDEEIRRLSRTFVSNDEKYIASLGNGYIMSYLAKGSMRKGFAYISDKRVYFKGSCLSGNGKNLTKTDEERTVDIKSVTGSGFIYQRDLGKIISFILMMAALIGIFILVCHLSGYNHVAPYEMGELLQDGDMMGFYASVAYTTLLGIILTVAIATILLGKKYLLRRQTLFCIEYAGGRIAFDVSFYAKAEIDDFQRQLRRAKDFAEETATVKTVTVESSVQTAVQNSVADELRKYADFLKEGLISQEEYETMKKKILGL